jgi:hypothetical protein
MNYNPCSIRKKLNHYNIKWMKTNQKNISWILKKAFPITRLSISNLSRMFKARIKVWRLRSKQTPKLYLIIINMLETSGNPSIIGREDQTVQITHLWLLLARSQSVERAICIWSNRVSGWEANRREISITINLRSHIQLDQSSIKVKIKGCYLWMEKVDMKTLIIKLTIWHSGRWLFRIRSKWRIIRSMLIHSLQSLKTDYPFQMKKES